MRIQCASTIIFISWVSHETLDLTLPLDNSVVVYQKCAKQNTKQIKIKRDNRASSKPLCMLFHLIYYIIHLVIVMTYYSIRQTNFCQQEATKFSLKWKGRERYNDFYDNMMESGDQKVLCAVCSPSPI